MRNRGNSRPATRVTLAVCVLMMATVTLAADHPGTWTAQADLPERLYFAATAEVDGILYVFGGSPSLNVVDTVFAYDPVSDLWSEKAPMPTARSVASAAAVNGKIYVFGGTTDLDVGTVTAAVEVYDPETNAWDTRSDMPTPLWGSAAAAVNGKIYVIGGGTDEVLGSFTAHTTVQIFDTAIGGWITGAPMPTPRATISAAVVDGLIFTVGGAEDDSASKALEIYDPSIDSWWVGADMSIGRDWFATAAIDGKIYALGGLAWGTGTELRIIHEVEVYNPQNGHWEQSTRMPDQRFGVSAVTLDEKIVLIGGANRLQTWATNRVDAYEPKLYTRWTEAAAHLSGAYGSQWKTDLCAANFNGSVANVELVLHTETSVIRETDTIPPSSQKAFSDVVGEMGIDGKGLLQISSDQYLRMGGRTFNEGEEGTFGQFSRFQSMEAGFARGDHEIYLIGLRQEEGLFRTNLIFANTGIREATMYVSLYRCSGGQPLCTFPVTIAPGQFHQQLEPFANEAGEPNIGWGYARVMVIDGAGVLISASVIDSQTNDATTIMAEQ